MIRCPKHGPLLYGTRCVGCDCQHADLEPPTAFVPRAAGTVHMGFDLASGPDKTATVKVSRERVGDSYEFTVEEIDLMGTVSRDHAEAMARHQRRMDEAIWRAMNVPPEHFNCRSTVHETWGAPPHRNGVEIITDPADRRGVNAKRVGAHP